MRSNVLTQALLVFLFATAVSVLACTAPNVPVPCSGHGQCQRSSVVFPADSYASCVTPRAFDFGPSFTIQGIARINTTGGIFLTRNFNFASPGFIFYAQALYPTSIKFLFSYSSGTFNEQFQTFLPNTDVYFSVRSDGNGIVQEGFQNLLTFSGQTGARGTTACLPTDACYPLRIGCPPAAPQHTSTGVSIKELRFFNRRLSNTEVNSFVQGSIPDTTALVGWFKFFANDSYDASKNLLLDSSGNANNLLVTNPISFEQACVCDPGYSSALCNITTCDGILSTNPAVCNGQGTCVAFNQCKCKPSIGGTSCQRSAFSCYGVAEADSKVCNGQGSCNGNNTCVCSNTTTTYGNDCSPTNTVGIIVGVSVGVGAAVVIVIIVAIIIIALTAVVVVKNKRAAEEKRIKEANSKKCPNCNAPFDATSSATHCVGCGQKLK